MINISLKIRTCDNYRMFEVASRNHRKYPILKITQSPKPLSLKYLRLGVKGGKTSH